jgi:homoserine O-acetyltransferase
VNGDLEPTVASCALGDFELTSGDVLVDAQLTYAVYGELNASKTNCVVVPTMVCGKHTDNAWMIGPGRPLDPARWCIVMPNQFGSGLSTSPSLVTDRKAGPFPRVTIGDNVIAQRRVLSEELGVDQLALVAGFSMGALQAYEWAAQAPDQVARLLVISGAACTSRHTWLFLEGIKRTLLAGQSLEDGWFRVPPLANHEAVAWVWLGWAHGQSFINRLGFSELGYETLDAYLSDMIAVQMGDDPDDLLLQLGAWQAHDIAGGHGNTEAALQAIQARAIIMPNEKDLYFPPEDSAWEVERLRDAELRVISGDYGHVGGLGFLAEPTRFIDQALEDMLSDAA